jgi:hypothetical protein
MPVLYMDGFHDSQLPHWDGLVERHQPKAWEFIGELLGADLVDTPPPVDNPKMINLMPYLVATHPAVLNNRFGSTSYYKTANRFWYAKWESGKGWDAYVHDDEWLYFLLTSGDRDEGEKASESNWKGPVKPKPILPLQCPIDYVNNISGTEFQNHEGCKEGPVKTLGQESYSIRQGNAGNPGDGLGRVGGIVPDLTPTITIIHKWSGVWQEEFTFAKGFGRVRWTERHKGAYVRSVNNNSVSDAKAPLLFPCNPQWINPDWTMPVGSSSPPLPQPVDNPQPADNPLPGPSSYSREWPVEAPDWSQARDMINRVLYVTSDKRFHQWKLEELKHLTRMYK